MLRILVWDPKARSGLDEATNLYLLQFLAPFIAMTSRIEIYIINWHGLESYQMRPIELVSKSKEVINHGLEAITAPNTCIN